MKVYLVDNQTSGHHERYITILNRIECTENISRDIGFENNKKNVMKYFRDRMSFINRTKNEILNKGTNSDDIVHLLFFDNLYVIPLGGLLKSIPGKIIATLHHIPLSKSKIFMLKYNVKFVDKIVVHSEILKQDLLKLGILNVEAIEYPSYYHYEKMPDKVSIRKEYGIQDNSIVITALGGTRYDKGLDILLEAASRLKKDIKAKVLINIAGKEEFFKLGYIEKMAKSQGVRVRSSLGFLSDVDFMKNVKISDIIVLPYRRIFYGNSGPMTEALKNGIPIIANNNKNFEYYVNEFKAGKVFDTESVADLTEKIDDMSLEFLNKEKHYYGNFTKKDLTTFFSVDKFIESHKDLYKAYGSK